MPAPRARAGTGGSRVRLERPSAAREAEFLAAVRRSRRLHGPWVRAPSTVPAFRRYLRRSRQPTRAGYFVCRRDSGALVGVIDVSEIVWGNFRSAFVGYYALAPHARQGLMTEGLALVVDDAFRRLRLHRLEANIQPGNVPSRRLVRRLGFRREGFSPRYLRIAGRWRDHERWAIVREEWRRRPQALRANAYSLRPAMPPGSVAACARPARAEGRNSRLSNTSRTVKLPTESSRESSSGSSSRYSA
jgi:ribosomal-protein-alanine N-acetyltransferase